MYMDELPLYWTNPDLMETTATVVSAEPSSTGTDERTWTLVLDKNLFYPGGGGQPADRGLIDGCSIAAVNKTDQTVQYVISGSGPYSEGDELKCVLDAEFRRDSRQQHSGQHLLSAALSLEGWETVSVHLGSEYTGIEVSNETEKTISDETVKKVLKTCDRWIAEQRNIISRYLTRDELKGLELRRSLTEKNDMENGAPVRIVDIEDTDLVGCGGVHLKSTGAIGMILFTGTDKIRGRYRLNWLIGDRALEHSRYLNGQGQIIQKLLSAGPLEMTERIISILDENKTLRISLKDTEKEIGLLQAESWIAADITSGIVVREITGSRERMEAAAEILRKSDIQAVFLISQTEVSSEYSWLLYGGKQKKIDFDEFKSNILKKYDGSGGGKPSLWRGRISGDSNIIISEVRVWLQSLY